MTTLTILTYHRITDLTPDFTGHRGVVSCSPAKFRTQIEYLKRKYTITTFAQLKELLDSGNPLPARLMILTFDDGYRDNYAVAYPILKKMSVPATFFVTTAFIEGKEIAWWEQLSHSVTLTKKRFVTVLGTSYPLRTAQERHYAEHDLTRRFQRMRKEETKQAIAQLVRDLAVPGTKQLRNLFMTWAQAVEMSRSGMEILPHTVTHTNLQAETAENVHREIDLSCKQVKAKVKKSISGFSYPYGFYSETAKKYVKDINIPFATTTEFGINNVNARLDRFALRRMDVFYEDSLLRFKIKLNRYVVAVYRNLCTITRTRGS